MIFLSLFSGIEAASAAWAPRGWRCAAVSEIDPKACAVLAYRHPGVPNLGDITLITEDDIKALGHLDVVVFGSPCQDLSIAGERKGMYDKDGNITRSGLFFAAVTIYMWARKHCGARYALWENVPGSFSSNSGRDFASVVSLLAGIEAVTVPPNGWGSEGAAVGTNGLLEWSVLDAQWFGLAQRRKRVFAILDTGNWYDRSPILLQSNEVRGHLSPVIAPRQSITAFPVRSSDIESVSVDTFRLVSFGEYVNDGTACTMMRRDFKDATDLIAYNITFCDANGRRKDRPNGGAYITETDVVNTLLTSGVETHIVEHHFGVVHGSQDPCVSPDIAFALGRNGGSENVICEGVKRQHVSYSVRRLTPVESARLQGFADDHCDVFYDGKPLPPNAKYALFGNSMAVACMAWIGKRIDETHTESML